MTENRFEVLWAPVAIRDLNKILDYIEQDSLSAAQKLFDQIKLRSETLSSTPLRGRLVPEIARSEIASYRELLVPPYRLVYRVGEMTVVVVGLFDGRRDLEGILLSRLVGI